MRDAFHINGLDADGKACPPKRLGQVLVAAQYLVKCEIIKQGAMPTTM